MKRITKIFTSALAILTLLLCTATLLSGCGKAKTTGISISEANSPRTKYVEGQSLDLSIGAITAKTEDGKDFSVPLSEDEITVSGYDNSKLGKQTLTVEYKGHTASFEIEVVARMLTEGFAEIYFVGDKLDLTRGSVIITNDDLSTSAVAFSDARLSFEGFSSDSAGSKKITVKYTADQSTSYKAYFTVKVYSAEALDLLADIGACLSAVPTDWTQSSLGEYKSDIEKAVNLILILERNEALEDLRYTLTLLDEEREKEDFFKIIYSYYCYTAADGRSFIKDTLWKTLPMPDALEDWYYAFSKAEAELSILESDAALLHDTTDFMISYFDLLEISANIKKSNDSLCNDIYKIIDAESLFESKIRRGGYIDLCGTMLGNADFDNLWEAYIELSGKASELSTEEYAVKIQQLFNSYASASPSNLFGFLSSLNFLYGKTEEITLISNGTDKEYNEFFALLSDYYEGKLPDSAKSSFKQLLLAMESYSLSCMKDGYTTDGFIGFFDGVKETFGALGDEDKEIFNSVLGDAYEKYLLIYDTVTANRELDTSEYEIKINSLKTTLERFFEVLNFLSDKEISADEKAGLHLFLFSLYERADSHYRDLLDTKNQEVLTAIFAAPQNINGKTMTLDRALYSSRSMFISYMVSSIIDGDAAGGTLLWDSYSHSSLGEFLSRASYVMEYAFSDVMIKKTTVDAVMQSFRELSAEDKKVLYIMGPALYYDGLESYLCDSVGNNSDAKLLATLLLEAEYAYSTYIFDTGNADALDSFIRKMENAVSIYGKVTDTVLRDKYLKETYDFYLAIYNAKK